MQRQSTTTTTCHECGQPADGAGGYCFGHDYLAPMNERLQSVLRDLYAEVVGRPPRWRYWSGKDGHLYGWTTEKDRDGWFAALDYKPVGKGARSGKAEEWELVRTVKRRKRKDAKELAHRWYERSKS